MPDESAKEAALIEADSLAGDEMGAVAFILQCGFADARMRAAEHVHDRALLEQVLHAMRKHDRRVAKLMQGRIDVMVKQELIAKLAQECIAEAQRLLLEIPLVPNRVAELDRSWRSIGDVGDPYLSSFNALRSQIEARLAAQTALQRSVIDAIDTLRALHVSADASAQEQVADTLSQLENKLAQYRSAPELPSLPRNLLAELEREYQRLRDRQTSQEQHASASGTQKEILAELVPQQTAKGNSNPVEQADNKSEFSDALAAMELALQQGLLHVAVEKDLVLRSIAPQSKRVSSSQTARLNNARAELKRLQDWAKWGGNVSREQLIKAVEDLPAQKLSLDNLAKAVSGSRAHWKSLDVASGAAPRALWERFDAICTAAYAPVMERSKKQAQERQQNKDKAQALLLELHRIVETTGTENTENTASAIDWKRLANFQRSTSQTWQRMGHMDRKDRKRFDSEFDELMKPLLVLLKGQWQREIERRESLIMEAEQINASDRSAIDRVRKLQERWQELAKAMPLERKDDQALWQRFRTACDAVFAGRKEAAAAADAVRRKNADVKVALCVALEAASNEAEPAIRKLLRETEAVWTRTGQVPRAREQQLDARYHKAVAGLRARLDAVKHAEKKSQGTALFEKLSLCMAAESAVVANLPVDTGWNADWLKLPLLESGRENLMHRRFNAAVDALLAGNREYAATLQKNCAVLQQELLRLEIMAGLNSPPELSRERMQVQVEVLQSTLSGQKGESFVARLDKLCGLAALVDAPSLERIHRLLKKA